MRNIVYAAMFLALLAFGGGCTGAFNDSGGTYTVSVPSSDSVNVMYSETEQSASVVGGPITSSAAKQQE